MRTFLLLPLVGLSACSSTPPCEDRVGAFVMAQEFIKKDLKAPSTADFPMINAEGVSSEPSTLTDGRCAFNVRTYVDSQNSFGAQIRQTYSVTLAPDDEGKNWSLLSLSPY